MPGTEDSNQQVDDRPHIVFIVGDHEYGSEQTMPRFAADLERNYSMRTTVLTSFPDEYSEEDIPGLEALDDADLAVFYLRFRRLPQEQLDLIEAYLDSQRPVIGFRTSTHAFDYAPDDPRAAWNDFGAEVLGAPWIEHYGHLSSTDVARTAGADGHPVLTGVPASFHVRSWVYIVRPDFPPADAEVVLDGISVGPSDWSDREPQPVAWTWIDPNGRRVFSTTMGHPEDFDVPAFQRLVVNAVHWALDAQVPVSWAGPATYGIPYEKPFELRQGARVVFLGGGYTERGGETGYLETLLTSRYHDRQVTFRNLGWGGDTVNVRLRPLNFGSLQQHVAAQEPDLVFVAYGANESFEGKDGLEAFSQGYSDLLDMIEGAAGARAVLMSPTRHDERVSRVPDAAALNETLGHYTQAIAEIAEQREMHFVDLFEGPEGLGADPALTSNGFHLTAFGYWLAALRTEAELGLASAEWDVAIDVGAIGETESSVVATGTSVSEVRRDAEVVSFVALDDRLPIPRTPAAAEALSASTADFLERHLPPRRLTVSGLAPGAYDLLIDGDPVVSAAADVWARGVEIGDGPGQHQVEELRRLVVDKNRLFFFRWRAHNSEYIFGRRSESSGEPDGEGLSGNPQFAEEMARFDTMIAEHEARIAALAAPVSHRFTLEPAGAENQ